MIKTTAAIASTNKRTVLFVCNVSANFTGFLFASIAEITVMFGYELTSALSWQFVK